LCLQTVTNIPAAQFKVKRFYELLWIDDGDRNRKKGWV